LADAYALQELAKRGRPYGPVRLWGSAAFIVGTVGTGLLLDFIAARDVIWLAVGAFLAATIAALLLAPVTGTPFVHAKPRPSVLLLFRSPSFMAVIVTASLVQASHFLYYGFSALAWTAAGLDGTVIGVLWALGVVAEIILFGLSARLPPAFGPTMLLVIGATAAVVRWTAMAFDPPHYVLPVLQCLHALSFGATHLGAVQFIARAAPVELAATAQGYLSIGIGVTSSASVALAGITFDAYGTHAYAAMAAMAALGLGTAIFAHRARI
jgi:PPP family 3-phenylpropionic acid transporter